MVHLTSRLFCILSSKKIFPQCLFLQLNIFFSYQKIYTNLILLTKILQWIHLLVLFVKVVFWVGAEEESIGFEDITESVKECSEAYKYVDGILYDKTEACLKENGFSLARLEVEKYLTGHYDPAVTKDFCSNKRPILRQCFFNFTDIECGRDVEKYLPVFTFDALDAVLNYICADDGAVLQKILEDATLECIAEVTLHNTHGYINDYCGDKLNSLLAVRILKKSHLCKILAVCKTCYADFIQEVCPKVQGLNSIVRGIVSAVSSPCDTP